MSSSLLKLSAISKGGVKPLPTMEQPAGSCKDELPVSVSASPVVQTTRGGPWLQQIERRGDEVKVNPRSSSTHWIGWHCPRQPDVD